jgi:hypothetical protein
MATAVTKKSRNNGGKVGRRIITNDLYDMHDLADTHDMTI